MPINKPSCKSSKSIRNEAVRALGFKWRNGAWVKFTDNKYTLIAPSDDHPLNDVVSADQLLDFLLPFQGQCRHQVALISAYDLDASASTIPPLEPHTFKEVTFQQLIDKVRALSVQQYILKEH